MILFVSLFLGARASGNEEPGLLGTYEDVDGKVRDESSYEKIPSTVLIRTLSPNSTSFPK